MINMFPQDVYICTRIEDSQGYFLSSNSSVFETIKNGDQIFAYIDAAKGSGDHTHSSIVNSNGDKVSGQNLS